MKFILLIISCLIAVAGADETASLQVNKTTGAIQVQPPPHGFTLAQFRLVNSLSSFSGAFADLTGKPTTLAGYGITNGQPLSAALTIYSGITPSADVQTFLAEPNFAAMRTALNPINTDGSLTANHTITLNGHILTIGSIQIQDGSISTSGGDFVSDGGDLQLSGGLISGVGTGGISFQDDGALNTAQNLSGVLLNLFGNQTVTGVKKWNYHTLVLKGAISGEITVDVPDVAGTSAITFPAETGTLALRETTNVFAGSGNTFNKGLHVITSTADGVIFNITGDSNVILGNTGVLSISGQSIAQIRPAGDLYLGPTGTLYIDTATAVDVDAAVPVTVHGNFTVGGTLGLPAGSVSNAALATINTAGKVANAATTAVSTNTASTIVLRDVSGNFSAGTITATLAGNASTVTTIPTLTGDVANTGNATTVPHSVSFTVNGAGSAVTTGVSIPVKTKYGGTLIGYTMMCSPSGSVTFNVFRAANSAGLPTASIINNAGGGSGTGTLPAIASGVEGNSATFTNWGSTTITANDNLALNLTTVDGVVTQCTFVLYFR